MRLGSLFFGSEKRCDGKSGFFLRARVLLDALARQQRLDADKRPCAAEGKQVRHRSSKGHLRADNSKQEREDGRNGGCKQNAARAFPMRSSAERPTPRREHAGERTAYQNAFHDHGGKAVFGGKGNGGTDGQQHRITPHKRTVQQYIANAQRNGAQHDKGDGRGKQGDEQIDALEGQTADSERAVPSHVKECEHERLMTRIPEQGAHKSGIEARLRCAGMMG